MGEARQADEFAEQLEARFTSADDRVRLSHWTPLHSGVVPRIRLGRRWFSVLWIIPLGLLFIIGGVAICQELRRLAVVQNFIASYPGAAASAPVRYSGFPWWLRWQHFLNLFFMFFIIRAGIQILADHPRLYWNVHCTPGSEWFRFQHAVPTDRLWTAKDDAVTIPGWLGIPGIRHSIGLARWWHFGFDLLWVVNGIIFYVLLFTTYQWQRIVPMSWSVFPNALSTMLQYLSLHFPPNDGWAYYNSLQVLAYFITVFVAAPIAVITGLLQAPAIGNRLGRLGKIFNRQVARSIHFLVLCWFLQFIAFHLTMVFITGARENLNHMFAGLNGDSSQGFVVFGIALCVVLAAWFWASPFTIKHARLIQNSGNWLLGGLTALGESWEPTTQYSENDISKFFWPNGKIPQSDEFNDLIKANFKSYRLRIGGLVENPREFTLAELMAMPKQEQITDHFCIQGWTGIAKWGGVPMLHLIDMLRPSPDAHYVVFYSFGEGADGGTYYDVHTLENMKHHLTILAYEMNGAAVSILHGAPLRLRCENELGFKQVKWINAIEFVSDFRHLGAGEGGYNEDHEFFGYRAPI